MERGKRRDTRRGAEEAVQARDARSMMKNGDGVQPAAAAVAGAERDTVNGGDRIPTHNANSLHYLTGVVAEGGLLARPRGTWRGPAR
jgi:hypothetical protein